jgi:glycosyltransferase involved in cell wall biosynthesis
VRVALDTQLGVGTATGIGEYAVGLARALADAGVDVVPLATPRLDPWRFDRRVVWDQVVLPWRASRTRADLLHCASGTMPLFAPLPVVVTVHDVAWLRVQAHARPYARAYFGDFSLGRYRHARRILVDSHFSRGELLKLLDVPPERVAVAYPGVATDIAAVVRRPRNDARFILAVGTVERRKNLETVIRALPALPGDVRLISVGPPTAYLDDCRTLAATLDVLGRVEFRGYVPRDELLELYASANVAAVSSLYEGFGYGAAQALCAGLPLVAAHTSSLPEVIGGAAPLVPPQDAAAWSSALAGALADERAEARSAAARAQSTARFAWPAVARSITEVYRAALHET